MKIFLTVDPEIPVPPKGYGGIERIVSSLCKAYSENGHVVYLMANPKSAEKNINRLIAWKGLKSRDKTDIKTNAIQLLQAVKKYQPDIVHSFSRLLYLYPLFLTTKIPVVQSYQRKISTKSTKMASVVAGKKLQFTACGAHMFAAMKSKNKFRAIHNFTDTDYFRPDFNKNTDFLFFLGRIEPIKGTSEAIQAALAANQKLIIAGNIPDEHQSYFKNKIEPHFSNPLIEYVGTVNDEQKLKYLQKAKALLFPIKWEEPFGIVMAEAMACGCPVIGFKRGSVPEVVKNSETGFIVENTTEMSRAIGKTDKIDRQKVRIDAEKRFSLHAIAEKYLNLFHQLVDNKTGKIG